MSCGSSGCAGYESNPRSRDNRGPGVVIDGRLQRKPRRAAFFSNTLHGVSQLAQNPLTISFREFAILVFILYALYETCISGGRARQLLFDTRIELVCGGGASAAYCMSVYSARLWWMAYYWAASVVPWSFVGVLVVFFVEEGLRAVQNKRSAKA